MEDLEGYLKANANKFFWLIVIVILAAWFVNEYTTTKRLVREQASLSFSNLSDQIDNIIYQDQTIQDGKQNNSLDNLNRFKSEINRLTSEFDGTFYAKLGPLLKAKFGLATNDQNVAKDLESFLESSKLDSYDGQSVEFVIKEIAELLKARALLNTKDDGQKKSAKEALIHLIKTAEIVPVEAYVTYVLSLPKDDIKDALSGDLLNSFTSRKPELKEMLEEELSKYGISITQK